MIILVLPILGAVIAGFCGAPLVWVSLLSAAQFPLILLLLLDQEFWYHLDAGAKTSNFAVLGGMFSALVVTGYGAGLMFLEFWQHLSS